uniref:Micrurotoxin 1 n=1 Tax=Micrurus mipartitus TaxID=430902 RepID=3NX1_MICMP|nr:RecName: Full=Micrurotoxin 1; Short=MmTX1 [Micrurus mipartitus]
LTCKTCPFTTCPNSESCPGGQSICYQRKWEEHRGERIERRCVANCPAFGSHDTSLLCCTRDNCN